MWKWGLPWFWAEDVAHETIHLKKHLDAGKEETRSPDVGMMPQDFVHIPMGGGKSYENPIKYIQDVLRLENQIFERLRDGSTLEKEAYHLYYLCQSFNYAGMDSNSEYHCDLFPYGRENAIEFNKRGIFYWTKYMENFGEDWYVLKERGYLHKFAGDKRLAIKDWIKSYSLNPKRSESLFEAVRSLFEIGEYSMAAKLGKKLLDIKCPYPEDTYFVEYNKYHDTGWWVGDLVARSLHKIGMETEDKAPVKMADKIIEQLLKRKEIEEETREMFSDYRGFFKSFLLNANKVSVIASEPEREKKGSTGV
jgi:tetratricopeptide (TPR) repeat protein